MTSLTRRPEDIKHRYIAGDSVPDLIGSVERLFGEPSRTVFVDTSIFYFPMDEITNHHSYSLDGQTAGDFIRKGIQFNQGLASLLHAYPNVAIIWKVLGELEGNMELQGSFARAEQTLQERLEEESPALASDIRQALGAYRTSAGPILEAARERLYRTDRATEGLQKRFVNLLHALDDAFALKKREGREHWTDEYVVASGFASATQRRPATIIARDNDIHNLVSGALRAINDPVIESLFPDMWGNLDLTKVTYKPTRRPKGYAVHFNTRDRRAQRPDWPKPHAYASSSQHRTILDLTIDALRESHELVGIPIPDVPRAGYAHEEHDDPDGRAKRATKKNPLAAAGAEDPVELPRFQLTKRERSRRHRTPKRLFYATALQPCGPEDIPVDSETSIEPIDFGIHVVQKYADSPDGERSLEAFARKLAREFAEGAPPNGRASPYLEAAPAFVEYCLFLQSLRGPGRPPTPADMDNFFSSIKSDGRLDWTTVRNLTTDPTITPELFGEAASQSPRASTSLFGRYLAYRAIPYRNREPAERTDQRVSGALAALDEAITKYGITDANVGTFLLLALNHLEWGLSTVIVGRPEVSLASLAPLSNPSDRLYRPQDIFTRTRTVEPVTVFRALGADGADPVFAERDGMLGYFVTPPGAAAIITYLDQNRAIDYARMRSSP